MSASIPGPGYATGRILLRFTARAIFDEKTWDVKQEFDPPILSKDELIDLVRQVALKPEEEITKLVDDGVLRELKEGYTLNVRKKGLFRFMYKFLFSDRSFLKQSVDGYQYRSMILSEFYLYMAGLEGAGVDTENFLSRYPLTQVKVTTSKEYNSYYKAVLAALNKMVLFGLLDEKSEGNEIKYMINHDLLAKHAPEELIEHQTHVILSDLGIYSNHATELSLHNIYLYIKHGGIDWRGLLVAKFPALVKTFFHMKINIDIEAEIIDVLGKMRDATFIQGLLVQGVITKDEYSKGSNVVIGSGGWYFDLKKKRIFHSFVFEKGGEMTIYFYRGLHQGLAGIPSMHVTINQELTQTNKEAITYFRFLSIMDWLDDVFLVDNKQFLPEVHADDFKVTNVEYNIDMLVNDGTMQKININEQCKEMKVQAFKIMLRIYDMTSVLKGAIDAGKLSAFSSLGDVTKFIDDGLNNFIRFEQRSTEPATVKLIKDFLKRRADYVLQGTTHQTIIKSMLGIENLAYQQKQEARRNKEYADRIYTIQMDEAWIKVAARNMTKTMDRIEDNVHDGLKAITTSLDATENALDAKIDGAFTTLDTKIDARVTSVNTKIDAMDNFGQVQFDELGQQISGLKTTIDGFEGEIVQDSMVLNDIKAGNQALLVEMQEVKGFENGIRQILERQQVTEQDRIDFEKQELLQKKESELKREKQEAVKILELERKEHEKRLLEKLDQFINSCQVKWSFDIAREIHEVMYDIDLKALSLKPIKDADRVILDMEKVCLDSIVKKTRLSKQYWFDKTRARKEITKQ